MSFRTGLILLSALLSFVTSEFPFDSNFEFDFDSEDLRNDDPTAYRVPRGLEVSHADLEVTPYFDVAPTPERQFTFDGQATLHIEVENANLNSIILQENVRSINSVDLTNADGQIIPLNANRFDRIQEFHFLRINLPEGVTLIQNNTYLLTIDYVGNIHRAPLRRGMFSGNYRDDNGNIQWYAATHLQPTHARQLLPCLDEPGYKSTFNITVNRPANFAETFSNMRIRESIPMGDRTKEVFYRTPRMSAYLVTIHISSDFTVLADNHDEARSYRIIGRPNARNQASYALEVGPPLTTWFEEYLGIEYYAMEEGLKNDQLAIPEWASGATENWGLVSYRELRLLYEAGQTNVLDKMYIGTITAHELAHKWFGNLITAKWWDNVWINEGFASYFEYFAMDGVDETLQLADQFNIMYLQSALASDQVIGTRALNYPSVNSPTEVTGHFSGISYTKGASMLQMFKHLLTEPTFRKALNIFLTRRAFDNAVPEDFTEAVSSAQAEDQPATTGLDIGELMKPWIDAPGYPVLEVNVDLERGRITLVQERFFINSLQTTTQFWPIPITYVSGLHDSDASRMTPVDVMTMSSSIIDVPTNDTWYIFNVRQQGLYRVNYNRQNWLKIAEALRESPSSIHHLNRAQIVDDVFALMRSGRMPSGYFLGFQVLEFLKHDSSYYSWYPAITGFSWLRNRLLHLPTQLAQFDAALLNYMERLIAEIQYDVSENEPISTTLNRLFLLSFACNIGHRGCIDDAVARFSAFRSNSSANPVNPNLRRHVFCEGLRAGNNEDYQFLLAHYRQSNNQADQVATLRALGCTSDPASVAHHLEMVTQYTFDPTVQVVPPQDRVNALTWLYMGNRENAKTTLQFFKTNVDRIRQAVILPASFSSVLTNLASYLDEEGLQDMDQWLRDSQTQAILPEFQVGLNAITSTRSNMQWGTDRADEIVMAVRDSASTIIPTFTLLFATVIAIMLR